MHNWPVMKLCDRQLKDINPNDILLDGLYRQCDTYKGGGGYDQFPRIYDKRYAKDEHLLHNQFVVQLRGCPLRCPYCYVTTDGVHDGECVEVSTQDMVGDFYDTGLRVFHLMGGAPAIHINYWHEILDLLRKDNVFHSDLLLLEHEYDNQVIEKLASYKNALYAVSIKGCNREEFLANTGTTLNENLFWRNFEKIVAYDLPFYLTFTGMPDSSITIFKHQVATHFPLAYSQILEDSFKIDLVHYEALD